MHNLFSIKKTNNIQLNIKGSIFKAFLWNGKSSPLEPFINKKNKKQINIAGRIRLNEWRGRKNFEFIIEDISID